MAWDRGQLRSEVHRAAKEEGQIERLHREGHQEDSVGSRGLENGIPV